MMNHLLNLIINRNVRRCFQDQFRNWLRRSFISLPNAARSLIIVLVSGPGYTWLCAVPTQLLVQFSTMHRLLRSGKLTSRLAQQVTNMLRTSSYCKKEKPLGGSTSSGTRYCSRVVNKFLVYRCKCNLLQSCVKEIKTNAFESFSVIKLFRILMHSWFNLTL